MSDLFREALMAAREGDAEVTYERVVIRRCDRRRRTAFFMSELESNVPIYSPVDLKPQANDNGTYPAGTTFSLESDVAQGTLSTIGPPGPFGGDPSMINVTVNDPNQILAHYTSSIHLDNGEDLCDYSFTFKSDNNLAGKKAWISVYNDYDGPSKKSTFEVTLVANGFHQPPGAHVISSDEPFGDEIDGNPDTAD